MANYKKVGEGDLFEPTIAVLESVRYRCRHLMIDAYFMSPDDCDDNFLKHESFFGLQQRFEKLVRYVKFYIKEKQEKRVYLTPRQRESDRLELIYEVLVFSPYMTPFSLLDIQTKDEGIFHCKASDLQPRFLIDTLGKACKNQTTVPDETTQMAEDLTKFYEEIFIPEGGVPLLQQNDMKQHFLWVSADCKRDVIMLFYTRIILHLASSNSSNAGSEPTVHITWLINTTSSGNLDLVEFERFYDEKADGIKRNAKILSSKAHIEHLKVWKSGKRDLWAIKTRAPENIKTRAPENMNPTQEHGSITQPTKDQEAKDLKAEEGLVQMDMVDTLEENKASEKEGSARMEKNRAVEAGVDGFDVMEHEGKEKKAMESADKLQGLGDRKPGRKGRKPKNSKAKVKPLSSEGPLEIVPSDNDTTNEAQMEDKNPLPKKKPKAPPKGNGNRKKKQRRRVERSAGMEKEQAIKSGVGEFDVMEFEEKEKKLAMEPADKLQGNRDTDLEATMREPIVQPKDDKLQVQKDRKAGRKGRKPKNSKAKVEPLCTEGSPEGLPEIVPSDNEATNDAPNEVQMEDKNAHPRKKCNAPPSDNANRKKKQRSDHSTQERGLIKIDKRSSSSKKGKNTSKRRGKR